MNCPLCIDQILLPHHRGGVEVDVCPQCKGVWLDRGELDKLMASPSFEPPATSERREDRSKKDSKKSKDSKDSSSKKKSGKKKKKKSSFGDRLGDLLEDVLDFD